MRKAVIIDHSSRSHPYSRLYISMGWASLGKDGKFDWLNDRWFVCSFARERMGRGCVIG